MDELSAKQWQLDFIGGTNNAAESEGVLAETDSSFPLTQAKFEEVVCIVSCRDRSALNRLGLSLGQQLQVINRTDSGSVVIRCNDRYLGIGKAIAAKIFVISQGKL